MDSKPNTFFRAALAIAATLLSGACFYFGTGLYPVWWLVWLAPVPILLLAPRTPWWLSCGTALGARILGGLSLWSYHRLLRFPVGLSLGILLFPAIAFALAVLLFRSFFRREQPWAAIAVFPSLIVSSEYLSSLVFGTFENTAYTQMNDLPVLQVGALTGLWGISFVVMLLAPMLATVILGRSGIRRRAAIALAVAAVCILSFGTWRLADTPRAPHSVLVGLAASDRYAKFPSTGEKRMQLMRLYAGEAQSLAAHGARIVVLPEMTALIPDSLSGQVDELFEKTAREAHAQILLGVLHATPSGTFNEARLYSESGAIDGVYRKHHLVPVMESGTTPGTQIDVFSQPVGTVGVEICRDMDYPALARRYGKAGVGLLLVPAWDFDVDRWSHGRMALMRAVEDGFSVVRSVKLGLLTVSDDRGRVLAETSTTPRVTFSTLLLTVPVRHDQTLYQKWGDWFAWLNLAGFCALVFRFLARSPRAPVSGSAERIRDHLENNLLTKG
jgi:apolipoprotein N-acyltransferase